jgi:catechol 2,3-dioxygenase-like lactoylglutathione lyase family enzyme
VFDHVTIRVSDRAAAERFYDTVLATLGIEKTSSDESFPEWDDFSIAAGDTPTHNLYIGFAAPDRAAVDAFHAAGTQAGYKSDGEPGPRPEYGDDYYGGFLLDPDGNSVEAVNFEDIQHGVDHLWVRVGNVAASKRFYETIAPYAQIRLGRDTPERAQFLRDGPGSFSVLSGDHVTESVHLAFGASDNQAVDAFHAAALSAGYRDNGTPGERPHYHHGYYSAYVLDPDGNNIEVVNHNR